VSLFVLFVALTSLMLVVYRGYSVILFAPLIAVGAVFFTDPSLVAPLFTGIFMEKMSGFIKLYFPVFLLGAVFGKLIEISGFSASIVAAVIKLIGHQRAMLAIVIVCAVLTYFGVSLFVVVFAVYPFAAEMFKQGNIPKRLIPATIALGAFTFTMDSLPGTPQIQNIIPTTFFKTDVYAAPALGIIGGIFIAVLGMTYLSYRYRQAVSLGEGYGEGHTHEPEPCHQEKLPHPLIALLPLLLVGLMTFMFSQWIPAYYGESHTTEMVGAAKPLLTDISKVKAIWAVEAALLVGIMTTLIFAFSTVKERFAKASKVAISGALLAVMNTASEYGFGGVIAALPGFIWVADSLKAIPNPLINEAISVTVLAGITGSASGGMSIALVAMAETFIHNAQAAGIPLEVLHRVASMASGGMDTLPHNGAVMTLLSVTGLTHKESYRDIFCITLIKTLAVFFVIGVYYVTGIV
jgi:H+/gluconate symporter-like permease